MPQTGSFAHVYGDSILTCQASDADKLTPGDHTLVGHVAYRSPTQTGLCEVERLREPKPYRLAVAITAFLGVAAVLTYCLGPRSAPAALDLTIEAHAAVKRPEMAIPLSELPEQPESKRKRGGALTKKEGGKRPRIKATPEQPIAKTEPSQVAVPSAVDLSNKVTVAVAPEVAAEQSTPEARPASELTMNCSASIIAAAPTKFSSDNISPQGQVTLKAGAEARCKAKNMFDTTVDYQGVTFQCKCEQAKSHEPHYGTAYAEAWFLARGGGAV